ncbi:retrovirus-related pol polyprotein from transposon TNT 1-94 [Tanacetum coccineum]
MIGSLMYLTSLRLDIMFPRKIGLKCSTCTCRSQPIGNKKNDRISQTPSSNLKNKVEVQHNGTEFVNQTLRDFYENIGNSHQTFVARTPQQNNIVKRQNRTLMEASHTMLIFSKAPLFLWTEAINTACYTQNRSLICLRYNKTPYERMHDKKPNLLFLHVLSLLCYPTNDIEDLGKLNAKADIGIFGCYAPAKKAFRIYNRRTRTRASFNDSCNIQFRSCSKPFSSITLQSTK